MGLSHSTQVPKRLCMGRLDAAIRQAELESDRELNSRLGDRMNRGSQAETTDGLRNTILGAIAGEHYDRAVQDIDDYVESKSAFPEYRVRTARYVAQCKELIRAIQAKRGLPGVENLTMSKQQALSDKAMEHFEQLKLMLAKMEALYVEVKMDDVRSTVWVLKAIVYCTFALLVLGVSMELTRGVFGAADVLIDSAFGSFTNVVFDKIGF